MPSESIEIIKNLNSGGDIPLKIRNKEFGLKEIKVIKKCLKRYYSEGRTRISKEICKKLDWRQPNGWLKDRACRDVLLKLQEMKILELPPPKNKPKSKGNTPNKQIDYLKDLNLDFDLTSMPSNITLKFAKGNKLEKIWNQLVDKFHYLGHSVIVGRCIKYLICSDEYTIGAISFSSPAYNLGARDSLLKGWGYNESEIKFKVINNSRFLILPNVHVSNLASKVLSISATKIKEDWEKYYSICPDFIETFVHPSLFDGTCYKAANWTSLGYTKGYKKSGSSYQNSQEPKEIYLYGLNKWGRKKLETVKKNDI